jgi:cell division protein FtsB
MKALQRVKEALVSRLAAAGEGRAPRTSTTGKVLLFLLILAGITWFVLRDHGLLDHARLRTTLDSLKGRSEQLQTQISWYRGRNRRLQASDSFTLEEEARRLGMARPGEELYRVVLPQDTLTRPESEPK